MEPIAKGLDDAAKPSFGLAEQVHGHGGGLLGHWSQFDPQSVCHPGLIAAGLLGQVAQAFAGSAWGDRQDTDLLPPG